MHQLTGSIHQDRRQNIHRFFFCRSLAEDLVRFRFVFIFFALLLKGRGAKADADGSYLEELDVRVLSCDRLECGGELRTCHCELCVDRQSASTHLARQNEESESTHLGVKMNHHPNILLCSINRIGISHRIHLSQMPKPRRWPTDQLPTAAQPTRSSLRLKLL